MGITAWTRRNLEPDEQGQPAGIEADDPVIANQHSSASASSAEPSSETLAPEKLALWEELRQEVDNCTACSLHTTRTNTVFADGSPDANWMFVGEAPGGEEDRQGIPFVGRAGQLLDAMLFALGLKREQVCIANVLKCRPPGNRDPRGEEVQKCEPFLLRQIELVQPRVIVVLGRFAAHSLLRTEAPIGKLRGRVCHYGDGNIPLIVTYHPAYLLRNPADKKKSWDDLKLASSVLRNAVDE